MTTIEELKKYNNYNEEKGINDISDLVLVHVTNYLPTNGVIKTPKTVKAVMKDEAFGEPIEYLRERDTIHFCVNGCVSPHTFGKFNAKYAIIIPLKNVPKEQISGGHLADMYVRGDFKIPSGSFLMCPDDEQVEEIENLEIIQYKKNKEVPFVNSYVDLVLNKLGYTVKSIGDYGWAEEGQIEYDYYKNDAKKAKEILINNGINYNGQIHTWSEEARIEHAYEANNRTQQVVKKLIELGTDSILKKKKWRIEDNIYLRANGPTCSAVLNYDEKEYINDLYKKLEEIGVNIPDSIKKEIEEINLTGKLSTNEVLNPDNNVDRALRIQENLAGFILIRRIVGEIKLKEISKTINGLTNYTDLLETFDNELCDYITIARKDEYLRNKNINLTKYELEIINDRKLLKEYLFIDKLMNIKYSDLNNEQKEIINRIKYYFSAKSDNYYITKTFIKDKDFLAIMNSSTCQLTSEESQVISSEIIGKEAGKAILNFEFSISNDETLVQFLNRYNEYMNKIVQALGEKGIKYKNSNVVLDTLFNHNISASQQLVENINTKKVR